MHAKGAKEEEEEEDGKIPCHGFIVAAALSQITECISFLVAYLICGIVVDI